MLPRLIRTDIDYYLHKQILPPVERLCAPIAGTNVTRLAECLGLDTSKYRVSTVSGNSQDVEIHPLESQIPDEVRFKDSFPFTLRCPSCKHQSPFRGLVKNPEMVSHDGLVCTNSSCGRAVSTLSISSQLEAQIRQHTARYYAGWLVCDDPACGARTRQMSVYGHRCLGPQGRGLGCAGRMSYEFGDKAMYNQLLFLQSLFDVDKAKSAITKERGMGKAVNGEVEEKVTILAEVNRERFETWKDIVKAYLDRNGRQWVQMDSLFSFALKVAATA